jgi:hypothetical protein
MRAVVVSVALALVLNLATNTVRVTWPWWPAAVWTAVMVLVLASVSVEYSRRRDTEAEDPAAPLERAAAELAGWVRRQWEREAGLRGLLRPRPLRVRWSSTERLVAPPAGEVLGPTVGAWATRLKLHGDVTEIAVVCRKLPARQLVVIGAPGAGKTSLAVLLVCGLLRDRQPEEPVPVLMNLFGWNPTTEPLDTWLARRLAELYPALTGSARFGPDAADRLVDGDWILPVLDGLDEMPEELRTAAVAALTDAVGVNAPLVLTCRSEEYQNAVQATGIPLARAAVVELEPVTGHQAAAYLPAGQIDGHRRWARVTAHLEASPDGALATALSTPLMVYLARVAYTPPHTDPAELLRFADSVEVEDHLLQAYLPAIYASSSGARTGDPVPPMRDYPADQARLWLAFLARHVHEQGDQNIAWWHLIHAVSRHELWCGTIGGLVGSLAAGLAAWLAMGPWMALIFGIMGALWVGLMGAGVEGTPHIVRRRSKWRRLAVTSMLSVLTLNLQDRGEALNAGPAADDELLDPRLALRNDLVAILVVGLGAGTVLGLGFGLRLGLEHGLAAGLGSGVAAGLIAGLGVAAQSAWFKFEIARCWLAGRGLLPWRVLRFLDDAYRRGVLRRSGAEYQFRHARLWDHLAAG